MDRKNLLLLEYQDNFAHNMTNIAYGKIIEKTLNRSCCYLNNSEKRAEFDKKMLNFNLATRYISNNHAQTIKSKNTLKIADFEINDIDKIDDDIKFMFKFKNVDFIKNYDILEQIRTTNSIGIYINHADFSKIDYDFINRALLRINKYLKKPVAYIFFNSKEKLKDNFKISYKTLSLDDWREEFYFLSNCRHKIILNLKNSYSEGFWASVLEPRGYIVYDKELKAKKRRNWFAV